VTKVLPDRRSTAYSVWPQLNIHQHLTKAESSLAIQLRIEKTGLNAFLFDSKVPGITAACSCGHPRQTVKYIMLLCLDRSDRTTFPDLANPLNLHSILSNRGTLRKALHWFLHQGLLLQFQLALPVLRAIEQNNTPT
jgi:hypothetical protein